MDPLTAISFASNIIGFVDFAAKLFSTAHSLYVSEAGTTAENLELETLAEHIQFLAKKIEPAPQLQSTLQPLSTEDTAIYELARQCQQLLTQLLTLLNTFKVQGRHKKWKSIYSAMRSSRHSSEIDGIQKRLDRIRSQITSHLLVEGHEKLFRKLESIEAENRKQTINRSQDIIDLRSAMAKTFEQLSRKTDSASLSEVVSHSKVISRYSHEQAVLRYLQFEAMDDRQIAINPAHAATYSWVFSTDSSFVDWLRSDNSLFWISGKPGSGKSTFMKYASQNQLLAECLKTWAKEQPVVIAHFFFWDLGKQDLHKSQAGLLRSILCQIFRQQPSLITQVYPEHTEVGSSSTWADISKDTVPTSELLSAIQTISASLLNSSTKYCFFIDGLDEFEGKPNDIIQLIELLKNSLHVKMCVSSRPWNEFEKVFGQDNNSKLYMQELTRDDIEAYVRDSFEKDSGFQEFLEENEQETSDLIGDIVKSANGVFLWVRLVVQSLLEGSTNADRIVDLRRRLHEIPKDLNVFFDRILFGVDNFYHQQMSQFFQVTLIANISLPLICYWYMDQEDSDSDEPEYALQLEIQPLTVQKTTIRLKQMRKRLTACCKGLLEVQFFDSETNNDSSLASSVLFNWKVDFLHRTVRDFLRGPEMQKKLQNWEGVKFNANTAICGAILAQIKTIPQEKEYFGYKAPIENLQHAFQFHISPEQVRLSTELRKTLDRQRAACGISIQY